MDQRPKILLVDDQPRNLDALEAILESADYRLVRAGSAEEALLALLQDEFAAIVLDIKMPGVSGLELAHLIKQRKRTRHVPILFLTAHLLDEHDILRGYGAGAVDYLAKPVNAEILRSKIAVFVDLFRKTRALAASNRALEEQVAERQRAQEALRRAKDELESRVQERTSDLTLANNALRESEQRLRVAVDVSRTIVIEIDVAAGLVLGGPDLAELLGLPEGEVAIPLANFQSRFHPDDREAVIAAVQRCLEEAGDGGDRRFAMDHRIVRPDGTVRWIDVRAQAFSEAPEAGGRPTRVIAAMLDITDRKLAEQALRDHNRLLDAAVAQRTEELQHSHERLRQAERLATVGTLAAGLGHDMSNLLLPIRARLATLSESELPAAAPADVTAIREAAGYLQRLAVGLRLLAADPERITESAAGTDLANWWRDVEGVFRAALPRGVRLEGACPPGLPPAAIPASRLTQAVFNLVQNAGEALAGREGDGAVTVEITHVSSQPAPDSQAGEGAPAPCLHIVVSDNGPGMPAQVAARCFEPYFSTKVRAVSTGMGLPMVRAWIEAVGGAIALETSPGQGARFTIRLPAASRTVIREAGAHHGLRAAVTLDDRRSAALVSTMLRAAGADTEQWEGESVPDAQIWVAAGAAATLERVAAFLGQGGGRRVVVLEDDRPAFNPAPRDAAPPAAGRIRYLGRRPTTAELRGALLDALHDTRGPARAGAAPVPSGPG